MDSNLCHRTSDLDLTSDCDFFSDRNGETCRPETPGRHQEEEAEGHGLEAHPRQVRDHQQETEQRISVGRGFGGGLCGRSNCRAFRTDMVSLHPVIS